MPFILTKNRKARIEFANTHSHWTINDWKRVFWSDESKYNLKGPDIKIQGKRLDPKYTKGTTTVMEEVQWFGVVILFLVELDLSIE